MMCEPYNLIVHPICIFVKFLKFTVNFFCFLLMPLSVPFGNVFYLAIALLPEDSDLEIFSKIGAASVELEHLSRFAPPEIASYTVCADYLLQSVSWVLYVF